MPFSSSSCLLQSNNNPLMSSSSSSGISSAGGGNIHSDGNNENLQPQVIKRTVLQTFGPFHQLSKPFYFFFFSRLERAPQTFSSSRDNNRPQLRICANPLFFLLVFLLLLARGIFYLVKLVKSENLTLDWARVSLQFSLTLNAFGALCWMSRNGAFFGNFAFALLAASAQKPPNRQICSLMIACLFSIFFLYTGVLWSFLRSLELQRGRTNITEVNSAGGIHENRSLANLLISLDAIESVLASFISGLALAIFYLSFKTVIAQLEMFRGEELTPAIDNLKISQCEVFTRLEHSISALLRLAYFTSESLSPLGLGMFLTSVFLNLASGFISGAGVAGKISSEFNALQHLNTINWSILSVVLLFFTLSAPYKAHQKIREIKHQILLEESVWNRNANRELSERARNLVLRIDGIQIHKIGQQLFNLVLVAQMVLVWLLVVSSKAANKKPVV